MSTRTSETPASGARGGEKAALGEAERRAAITPSRWRERRSVVGWCGLTVAVILGIWEAISKLGVVDPIILPPIDQIATAFWDLIQTSLFWDATRVTVEETLIGYVVGCGVALIIGTLITLAKPFRHALYPLAVGFQNTPRIIFAPLFLTWFGFGITSKIVMAATICFFPLLLSVVVAVETVNEDARSLFRSYGASAWEVYRKLVVPSSLPYIFAGLKTAMTLALIGAIVGEFVGGAEGLGVLVKSFNFQLNVAQGFAVIFALGIMGLLLYAIVEFADKKIVFWRTSR